jgi:hypothetical protein
MVLLDKRPLQVRAVLNETNFAEWYTGRQDRGSA